VTAVTVARVDERRNPVPGTEQVIECDLLVLAVGLIPENELSQRAGLEIDPRTKGPVLDESFQTSVPGIFAAGNVAAVFDLVDYVSQSGEIAARGAAEFLRGGAAAQKAEYDAVEAGENVGFVVPQRLRRGATGKRTFYMRVKIVEKIARLQCARNGKTLVDKVCRYVAPPEMLAFDADIEGGGALQVEVVKGGKANG
jgi:pyruvate/2-oxoglutarate dehydrogenase complex dihydrolipoamide dehydrogenase (E3) component